MISIKVSLIIVILSDIKMIIGDFYEVISKRVIFRTMGDNKTRIYKGYVYGEW